VDLVRTCNACGGFSEVVDKGNGDSIGTRTPVSTSSPTESLEVFDTLFILHGITQATPQVTYIHIP
jgi:hypothetical protein